MRWVDWVAIGLIALLALRAVLRARKLQKQGCGPGGCAGCGMRGSCSLPEKEPNDTQAP